MNQSDPTPVIYRINEPVDNAALNALFAAAWHGHMPVDFAIQLRHSLLYITAHAGPATLAGFVNVAWDGGIHAFLLDTTVHPAWQRRGIGRELVRQATQAARDRCMEWLHVDYEPHLDAFYRGCGFTPTLAGLIRLDGHA